MDAAAHQVVHPLYGVEDLLLGLLALMLLVGQARPDLLDLSAELDVDLLIDVLG